MIVLVISNGIEGLHDTSLLLTGPMPLDGHGAYWTTRSYVRLFLPAKMAVTTLNILLETFCNPYALFTDLEKDFLISDT